MAFKINNKEEYVALKTCISLYDMLSNIIADSKDKTIEDNYMVHADLLTIKLNKVQKFLDLELKMKNSILMSLQVSMNASSAIQKELEDGEKETNMRKAIELANHFCQGYQEVYQDWTNAIKIYESSHPMDREESENRNNRISKIAFILFILGIMGISAYLNKEKLKEEFQNIFEEKNEENNYYDNTSLENMDVEQILTRKL